jgi:predicted NBD/HSP70 family sugar kinase
MAIPNDLRQMNRRRIVLAMLRLGTGSRTQLARATGLSQPTAGKIVDDLLAGHVLRNDDATATLPAADAGRTGRPAQRLRLDDRRMRFLAVQLGVRNTRVALLPVAPPTHDEWPVNFRTPSSASKWVTAVARAAQTLSRGAPDAVLVSAPGILDESTGQLLLSPNLPWANRIDLPALLRPAIGGAAAVHTMQEIRCLALGQLAAAPADESFLLVDFGTGVGSTAVVGGSPYRGPLPMIGEIGHTPVVGNRRPCACGGVGCLETLVSRRAIVRATLGDRSGASDSALARDWGNVIHELNERGINLALAKALDAAGAVIAGALNALGLDRVVITGSLVDLPTSAVGRVAGAIRAGTMWARYGDVHVTVAPRRRLAGLASMAINRVIAPP